MHRLENRQGGALRVQIPPLRHCSRKRRPDNAGHRPGIVVSGAGHGRQGAWPSPVSIRTLGHAVYLGKCSALFHCLQRGPPAPSAHDSGQRVVHPRQQHDGDAVGIRNHQITCVYRNAAAGNRPSTSPPSSCAVRPASPRAKQEADLDMSCKRVRHRRRQVPRPLALARPPSSAAPDSRAEKAAGTRHEDISRLGQIDRRGSALRADLKRTVRA